jgi:hypothetical protein
MSFFDLNNDVKSISSLVALDTPRVLSICQMIRMYVCTYMLRPN